MNWGDSDSFNLWEADASYNAPSVTDVATTDILQETQASPTGSDQWTGFFQDVIKGAVGYVTAKDAAETKAMATRAQSQAAYRPTYQQPGTINLNGMMPLLLIGGVVFLLTRD